MTGARRAQRAEGELPRVSELGWRRLASKLVSGDVAVVASPFSSWSVCPSQQTRGAPPRTCAYAGPSLLGGADYRCRRPTADCQVRGGAFSTCLLDPDFPAVTNSPSPAATARVNGSSFTHDMSESVRVAYW